MHGATIKVVKHMFHYDFHKIDDHVLIQYQYIVLEPVTAYCEVCSLV